MQLVSGRPVSALRAVDALNQFDVVIVQHEFDVYGGPDGEDVLDVLATVEKPVITVLHTVLAAPAPHKRQVLQRIIDASGAVVVLSRAAVLSLIDSYQSTRTASASSRREQRRPAPYSPARTPPTTRRPC